MHVRMVLFPDGDDPDSYAQKHGSTALQEYLRDHEENFVLYKTRLLLDEVKNDPIRKSQALTEIVSTIALVPDMLERTEYVRLCSSLLNMPEPTIQTELVKALAHRAKKQYEEKHPNETATTPASDPATSTDNSQMVVDAQGNIKTVATSQESAPTNPVTVTPAPRVEPFSPTLFPDDTQERKIIELLLNHGHKAIDYPTVDEEGNSQTEQYFVEAVIVSELMNDQIAFDDPRYQTIFNDFAKTVTEGRLVDASSYINHEDNAIRELATSLMLDTQQISPEWDKRHIVTPKPEQRLSQDVLYAIRTLKLRKLDHKIQSNGRQFQLAPNPEDQLLLVQEKMHLVRLRQQLCEQLNCIVN